MKFEIYDIHLESYSFDNKSSVWFVRLKQKPLHLKLISKFYWTIFKKSYFYNYHLKIKDYFIKKNNCKTYVLSNESVNC